MAAAATLSDSSGPGRGMATARSQRSRTSRPRPRPSLPSTRAIGSVGHLQIPESLNGTGVEADRPQSGLAQAGQGAGNTGDGGDREVLGRPRRRLEGGRGERGGAATAGDQAGGAGRHRAAHDRPEVVRVGDAVEDDDERAGPVRGGTGEGVQVDCGKGIGPGHHTLGRVGEGQGVQVGPVDPAHGHPGRGRQVQDLGQ